VDSARAIDNIGSDRIDYSGLLNNRPGGPLRQHTVLREDGRSGSFAGAAARLSISASMVSQPPSIGPIHYDIAEYWRSGM
jgi:hypothetical protein